MDNAIRILYVDDNPLDRELVRDALERDHGDFRVVEAPSREQFEARLAEGDFDLVLTDFNILGFEGLAVIEAVRAQTPQVPVIIVTGTGSEEVAVEAMKRGAADYVIKTPKHIQRLPVTIQRALDHQRLGAERERAEEALRQSEDRYRLLYEDNPSMYFTVDAEGSVRSVNKFGAKQLGYTVDELVGQSVLKAIHEDDKQAVLEQLRACFQNLAQPVQWEFRKVRKDGSILWVREVARAVHDADGHPVGLIVCEDITERRHLEEQLRQAQKLESLGRLAGGVAHDFNNLLSGIIGFTELALREVAPDSKVHRYLSRVPQLGHQASDLIAQLLAFARKAPMERKPLDLNLLLNETGKMLKRIIPESIAIELAPASQPVVVQADLAQVQQILLNLSTNARDAMPEGGRLSLRLVPVTISEADLGGHPDRRQGQFACLTVVDTGSGIPAAIRDRIFEPFFTSKESGKGTGLGLASVHGIVHQHEGWIEVETAEGQGTAFRVFLPLLSIPAAAPRSVEEVIPQGVEAVLLVEDDPMLQELGETSLTQLGYTVFVAADGIEALEAFRAHPEIALVVTDAVMPRMSAVDLIPSLRALNPAIKVLVTTGYTPEHVRTTLDHLQLSGYIQKPFLLGELAQAVRSALDGPAPTGDHSRA